MSDTLYIKMDQAVEITKKQVTVGDVAKLQCKNKNITNRLKSMKLLEDTTKGKKAIYSFNNENYRNGRSNISECRYTKYRGNRMCC